MKKVFVLAVVVVMLLFVTGCTQSSPEPTSPQPTPAITKKPVQTPIKTIATTRAPTTVPPTERPVSVSDNTVSIRDSGFEPSMIVVKTGAIVRWVNDDTKPHRIQMVDRRFSAFLLSPGQSFSQKYDDPGVYDYTCLIHPSMHGTVKVE